MSFINQANILNIPHKGTNLKIGENFDFSGKSKLVIGENGTGKTTLLRMLYSSLTNKALHDNGIETLSYDIDKLFKDFNNSVPPLQIFEEIVAKIFGKGIINIWNKNFSSSKGKFISILMDKYHRRFDLDYHHEEKILQAIEEFSKKYQVHTEIIYGNLIMLLIGGYSIMENDVTTWGYAKIGIKSDSSKEHDFSKGNWKNPNILERFHGIQIVTNLSDEVNELMISTGERTKSLIERLEQEASIGIIDEPTNGIDRRSKKEFIDRIGIIVDGGESQVIISTHEEKLIDLAEVNKDSWEIIDLGSK